MSEKWNQHIVVSKESPISESKIDKHEVSQGISKGEKLRVRELKKNPEEKLILERTFRSIEQTLRFLDLPNLKISPEQIHIIDREIYKKDRQPQDDVAAFVRNNHAYIVRNEPVEFVHDLTHEEAHLLAYSKLLISVDEDKAISTKMLKNGLKGRSRDYPVGMGLDEGITELLSIGLREFYADLIKADDEFRKKLIVSHVYIPQMLVCDDIAAITFGERDEGIKLMTRDYISGDSRSFQEISKAFRKRGIPDALKILMSMDRDEESALRVAEQLGLKDAEEKIWELQK